MWTKKQKQKQTKSLSIFLLKTQIRTIGQNLFAAVLVRFPQNSSLPTKVISGMSIVKTLKLLLCRVLPRVENVPCRCASWRSRREGLGKCTSCSNTRLALHCQPQALDADSSQTSRQKGHGTPTTNQLPCFWKCPVVAITADGKPIVNTKAQLKFKQWMLPSSRAFVPRETAPLSDFSPAFAM